MIKKRDYVTLSVLGGIFLCLLFVYIFAVAPLLKEPNKVGTPPETMEGEYTNGATLSLYTPITDENLLEIKVENDTGEYSFVQVEENGKKIMAIKGHEKVNYDPSVYAYLSVFAKDPKVPIGGTVIRNVTEAEMSQYGTTDLLCKAKVTVTYKSGEETKTHKMLIGNKLMSSVQSYYVSYEGRDHVYLINAPYVENAIIKDICDYIPPAIYSKYENAAEAALDIKQFVIMLTTQSGEGESKMIVMVEQDNDSNMAALTTSFKFTYPGVYPQKIIASSDYVVATYGQLYINFSGERVVALSPDEATLEKYGLGKNQEQFMIQAIVKDEKEDNKIYPMYVSKEFIREEDGKEVGYHYILSGFNAEYTIVEVPAEQMFFLKTDDQTMLDWAATNSVFAGFSEYIKPETVAGAPGIRTIRVRTKDFNVEFNVTIGKNGELSIISTDGTHKFIDDLSAKELKDKNQFSNLYSLLLYYPMPSRYSTLTSEGKDNVKTEDNIIYELEAVRNDGKIFKYTYYTLDEGYSGYALCEASEGKIDENGNRVYEVSQTIFEVKSRHIGLIAEAYKIIMNGGKIITSDYIY